MDIKGKSRKESKFWFNRVVKCGITTIGIVMHNESESSLVSEVKERQDIDPMCVKLKKLVVCKKIDVYP